jgi:hypothetical protein
LADHEEEIYTMMRRVQAAGLRVPYSIVSSDIINKVRSTFQAVW